MFFEPMYGGFATTTSYRLLSGSSSACKRPSFSAADPPKIVSSPARDARSLWVFDLPPGDPVSVFGVRPAPDKSMPRANPIDSIMANDISDSDFFLHRFFPAFFHP